MKNKLVIISAPSGAGKSTLCEKILKKFSKYLVSSISYTTRAPRANESNGVNYYFISKEDFKKKLALQEFVEWAEVHGNLYGTSKAIIDHAFKNNKSVLLEIDVQGAEQILKNYPENTISIFISPPNLDVLENRLRLRGTDSEEAIRIRLENAKLELNHMAQFHFHIVNESLEEAYVQLKDVIKKELEIKE